MNDQTNKPARCDRKIKITALRKQLQDAGMPVADATTLEQASDLDPSEEGGPESFQVRDETSANWLVRKVVESRRYAERVAAWAAAEARRAEREERFLLDRYGLQLERWTAAKVKKLDGHRKSLALPAGTVGFRSGAAKLIVTEEQGLLDWCRRRLPAAIKLTLEVSGVEAAILRAWQPSSCPDAVATEHVAKSVVNQHVQDTGEVPNGTEWLGGETRFYIK